MEKMKRNDPCKCGSNQKFKHCCLKKIENEKSKYLTMDNDTNWKNLRITEGEILYLLKEFLHEKLQDERTINDFFNHAFDEFTFLNEHSLEEDGYKDIFEYWVFFDYTVDLENSLFPKKKKKINEITIAETCLNEKPQIFTDFQKKMLRTILSSSYSFYLIENVVEFKRIFVTDILLQKQLELKESKATLFAIKGSIIYAKVITIDNQSILFGVFPILIPNNFFPKIIECRDNIKKIKHKTNLQQEFLLRNFYFNIVEELNEPTILINSDDEPIVLHDIYYDLKCTCMETFNKLSSLNTEDEKKLLKKGKYEKNRLREIHFSWIKKDVSKKINNNLGEITILKNKLHIFVNSDNRANIIKHEIYERLGFDAILKEDKISDFSLSEKNEEEKIKELPILPEIKKLFKAMQKEYYEKWLDQKLPYLRYITPRQAAKTNEGKEKLKALLLQLEQKNEYHQKNNDHHMIIDLDSMKNALNL